MKNGSDTGEPQRNERRLPDEGCLECAAEVLTRVYDLSAEMPVPDYLVKAAISVFPAAPPSGKPVSAPELPVLVGRLMYNSLEDPQREHAEIPVGDLHLKYEAGNHIVDMHFEHETDSPEVVLVGQIASRSTPEVPPARVPVRVGTGKNTVSRAVTNRKGEFALAYIPAQDLRLSIPIAEEGVTVEICLDEIPGNRN